MMQQEEQETSKRHERKDQPDRLREQRDSENEDEAESFENENEDKDEDEDGEPCEDEAPLRKQSERRVKRTSPRRDDWSLEAISFVQLENKNKEGAQRVLHYYKDDKQAGRVHVCSRFIRGKCGYMCKFSRHLYSHMKNNHPDDKHPGYKIFNYPRRRDYKVNDFVTKPYVQLKKTQPPFAERVLALYKRPQNRNKAKVHLCGYFVQGKCEYISTNTVSVQQHMINKHSRVLPMVKVVGYPGTRERIRYEYEQMTSAQLKKERGTVAKDVLKCYYDHNCQNKIYLCGSCDYFSHLPVSVRYHVARHHSPETPIYKIIQYPTHLPS